MKEVAEILHDARVYIEEHGWTRGVTQDSLGRVCAFGAIRNSQDWEQDALDTNGGHRAEAFKVAKSLVKALYPDHQPANPIQVVVGYNDHRDRTEQEMLDLFAKAEKIELTGFDPDRGIEL